MNKATNLLKIDNDKLHKDCLRIEEELLISFSDSKTIQEYSKERGDTSINDQIETGFKPSEFKCDSKVANLAHMYNVFKMEEFKELKEEIVEHFKKFFKPEHGEYYLRGWINVMRNGECIDWHYHKVKGNKSWHGYYVVHGIGSRTYFGNNFKATKSIESVDGLLFMTETSDYMDKSSQWDNPFKERITIGYDIYPEENKNTVILEI